MKGCKIDMNIDITEAMKIDPSIAMIPPTSEEKSEYRARLDAWEKGGKKGERPAFDAKYFSAAEVWKVIVFYAIHKVYPTGNSQLLRKVKAIDIEIDEAIKNGGGILKTSQDTRNFLKSCFVKNTEWENSALLRDVVERVEETIDKSVEYVAIDRV